MRSPQRCLSLTFAQNSSIVALLACDLSRPDRSHDSNPSGSFGLLPLRSQLAATSLPVTDTCLHLNVMQTPAEAAAAFGGLTSGITSGIRRVTKPEFESEAATRLRARKLPAAAFPKSSAVTDVGGFESPATAACFLAD